MMRFIDLRNQGTYNSFAFFNTSLDTFVSINGEQTWRSRQDFIDNGNGGDEALFQRLLRLIPDPDRPDDKWVDEEKWETAT